ncbi:MAG: hypothetical protein IJ911_01825 [Salinivirgaceae bacterium]|nr:hypothetical protein [Salinivirgaceae bacterium]
MKRIVLCCLFASMISTHSAFAVRHHECSLSYGVGTHNEIVNGFANVVGTIFTLGYADITDLKWSGAYNMKYAYHPVKFLGLGVVSSYQTSKGDIVEGSSKNKDNDARVVVGKAEGKYFAIMPSISLNWFDFNYVCMYSKVAVGYSMSKSKQTRFESKEYKKTSENNWAYQLTPVALEAGSPLVRGFFELGFGHEGILAVGVKCKF